MTGPFQRATGRKSPRCGDVAHAHRDLGGAVRGARPRQRPRGRWSDPRARPGVGDGGVGDDVDAVRHAGLERPLQRRRRAARAGSPARRRRPAPAPPRRSGCCGAQLGGHVIAVDIACIGPFSRPQTPLLPTIITTGSRCRTRVSTSIREKPAAPSPSSRTTWDDGPRQPGGHARSRGRCPGSRTGRGPASVRAAPARRSGRRRRRSRRRHRSPPRRRRGGRAARRRPARGGSAPPGCASSCCVRRRRGAVPRAQLRAPLADLAARAAGDPRAHAVEGRAKVSGRPRGAARRAGSCARGRRRSAPRGPRRRRDSFAAERAVAQPEVQRRPRPPPPGRPRRTPGRGPG